MQAESNDLYVGSMPKAVKHVAILADVDISESEEPVDMSNRHSPLSVGCCGTSNHPIRIASQTFGR